MARARKGETGPADGPPIAADGTAEGPAAPDDGAPPAPDHEGEPLAETPADSGSDLAGTAGGDMPVAPVAAPRSRRGGFAGTVLGGAVAAGLGAAAATYVVPRVWTPAAPAEELAALSSGLSQQSDRIDALGKTVEAGRADAALAELAAAQADLARRIDAAVKEWRDASAAREANAAETAARLDALDTRLTGLEKRPVEGGAASASALDAFSREIAAFRDEMAAEKSALAEAQLAVAAAAAGATESIAAATATAEKMRAETEAAARRATARAALGRVEAALAAGGAIGTALAELGAAGVAVPSALADQAQGVPTLEALRSGFPPAARAALAGSLKETAGGSAWDRIAAFLKVQSGARSLTPRAGDDPDAVLSRAEAALAAGDLRAAVAGIGALPADGQARMAEWVDLATRRIAAVDAAAAIAADLE